MELALPELLNELLANGVWPPNSDTARAQNLQSLVAPQRVRLFAADEDFIFLQPPPFHTIAQHMAAGGSADFWPTFGALEQIVPSLALVIGDFGLGSDSPIILNYARCSSRPPVFRLRWGPTTHTEWVQGAADFAEFIGIIGLTGSVA